MIILHVVLEFHFDGASFQTELSTDLVEMSNNKMQ